MKSPLFASIALALLTATLVEQPRAGDSPFTDEGWVPKGRAAKTSPASDAKAPAPVSDTKPPAPVSGAKAPTLGPMAPASATETAPTAGKDDPTRVPAVVGLPPATNPDTTYRIAPDDQIEIKVFQVDELSTKERVSEKGVIVMPLVGPIKVAGLTPDEAEKLIADTLGREYLQNPQVDIHVVDATGQKITVTGSVKKPGVFPISGQVTLLQAISLAEGPDRLANREEVIVFRPDARGRGLAYVVDLEAVQRGDLADPVLAGNDRIVVPESGTAVFLKGLTDTLRGFVHFVPY